MLSFLSCLLLLAKAVIVFEGNEDPKPAIIRLACRKIPGDETSVSIMPEGQLMTAEALRNLLTSKTETAMGMINLSEATEGERKALIKILEDWNAPLPEPLINQLTMAELAQLPIVNTIMSINLDNLEQIKAIFRLADNDREFLLEAQRILKPKHTQTVPLANAETVLNLCKFIETNKPKISGGSLRGGPLDVLLTKHLVEEAVKQHTAKSKKELLKMTKAFGLERNAEADQKLAEFRAKEEIKVREISGQMRSLIDNLLPALNGGPDLLPHTPLYTAQDYCPELYGPKEDPKPTFKAWNPPNNGHPFGGWNTPPRPSPFGRWNNRPGPSPFGHFNNAQYRRQQQEEEMRKRQEAAKCWERQQAEEAERYRRAQEEQRRAEEEQRRAEEWERVRRAQEEQRRAEEEQRRAEEWERARRSHEEQRRAQEEQRHAEEEQRNEAERVRERQQFAHFYYGDVPKGNLHPRSPHPGHYNAANHHAGAGYNHAGAGYNHAGAGHNYYYGRQYSAPPATSPPKAITKFMVMLQRFLAEIKMVSHGIYLLGLSVLNTMQDAFVMGNEMAREHVLPMLKRFTMALAQKSMEVGASLRPQILRMLKETTALGAMLLAAAVMAALNPDII